ncbi:hypothetical protein QBC41DRAFT_311352 [Cercophora samala]|uniref:Uncharacterized protein n=1 Tax=Cercophora samala TaxID=330535 RepID=A0AA39ZM72_9PEZI|nr:hypothetical protein QBC41DRAFT_311352 [Cercophora samala]
MVHHHLEILFVSLASSLLPEKVSLQWEDTRRILLEERRDAEKERAAFSVCISCYTELGSPLLNQMFPQVFGQM